MRSHGDPKADVFQCAMLMWEIAAGRSPQHPSVQTHIPQYAKRQLPPSLMRTSGFLARVNFAPDTHYRPDLRVLPWKQFRSLVAEGWNPDAEKRSSAAELLRKLQTLPGRCVWRAMCACMGRGALAAGRIVLRRVFRFPASAPLTPLSKQASGER